MPDSTRAYVVTWTVDIDADSPEDAARQALEMHRDPESIATVFRVRDTVAHRTVTVDLED